MTDERKNEIWAMLDADTQEWIKGQYEEILEDIAEYKEQNSNNDSSIMENRAIGQKQMLIRLFGRHNLTAQVEERNHNLSQRVANCDKSAETTQESQAWLKFYIGQRVIVTEQYQIIPKGTTGIVVKEQSKPCLYYFVASETSAYSYFSIEPQYLAPYQEEPSQENPLDVAESVETSTKEDAYFAYRLDLAKEIAVAVIRSDRWDFHSCNPVEQANEIVKRLKETKE